MADSNKDASDQVQTAAQNNPQSPQAPTAGFGKVKWDNEENDPNKRKHVGIDPEGKKNKLK